jgi:Protein of unknown function with HXXEE motif
MRLRSAVWLAPPAFALHVAEEAPGFTRWVNRHISEDYGRADFVRINAAGLAMTVAATALVARRPARPLVFAYFTAIVCQQAANAGFHAGATAAYRAYSPGLATSILLYLPLWRALARRARRERLLSRRANLSAAAFAGLLHAHVVSRQVFRRRI